MWCSGVWPSFTQLQISERRLHPTCLMCGRLVCGPHKQMVQPLPSGPVRRLQDGTPFLKLNPNRMCRRISDPWMVEAVQLIQCSWTAEESAALVASVKLAGHLGWDGVKEHLLRQGITRTSDQCQNHWREVCSAKAGDIRDELSGTVGERWRHRDNAISAEIDAVLEETPSTDASSSDLGSGLIIWSPLLACYLAQEISLARPPASLLPEQIQEDFLVGLSAFFRTPLIDRTGVLNQDCSLRLHILDPVPQKQASFCKDLSTVMDERAVSLLSLADTKCCKLEVLWSGGIDSTSLLVALLRALHPGWRPSEAHQLIDSAKEMDRLIVRCSADSIAEYPWFHEHVLLPLEKAGAIAIETLADSEEVTMLWEGPQSRITVTGECGDQIFGSQLLEAAFVPSELYPIYHLGLDAPWQDTLLQVLLDMGVIRPEYKDRWLAWFTPFVAQSPVPIITTFDVLWWLNLACKWQTVCLRLFQRRPHLSWSDLDRIVHFFQTEDFQQWSFVPENHAAKMADHKVWSTYKQPLKEYIFCYTQDRSYFNDKLKAGSLCQVNDASHFVIMGIDNKLNVLRFGPTCLSRRQMDKKYPKDGLRAAFWRENGMHAQCRAFASVTLGFGRFQQYKCRRAVCAQQTDRRMDGGTDQQKEGSKEARKPGSQEARKPGSQEARKPGSQEARKPGSQEARIQGFKDSRIQGFKDSRIQGSNKQGSKEARKPGSQEARKQGSKEARKQGSKEARKQGSKAARKRGSKEARKPGSQEARKPGSKEARKQGSKEARKPGSQEARKPGSQEARKPGSKEARKQGSKEARKQGSKAARQQGSKAARKQGSKEARKQGSKEARKQGSKEARKQGSKEARKQGSKEARNQGSKEARKQGSKEISDFKKERTEGKNKETKARKQKVIIVIKETIQSMTVEEESSKDYCHRDALLGKLIFLPAFPWRFAKQEALTALTPVAKSKTGSTPSRKPNSWENMAPTPKCHALRVGRSRLSSSPRPRRLPTFVLLMGLVLRPCVCVCVLCVCVPVCGHAQIMLSASWNNTLHPVRSRRMLLLLVADSQVLLSAVCQPHHCLGA
ncbi:unnamed protein product [Effrenium voratum]|nr:unnamed protein product [Effrenium voratum]